jgi:DNA-directed RNA polymerase beta subunit
VDNVLIGGRQSALLQPPKPIAPPATSALMSPSAMSSLPAPPLVPAAPPKKKETGYRDIFDPVATRTAIFEDVRQAARDTPEIANQRHILRLKDVDYDGDQRYDYTAQKKAILSNKSLNRRLLGTWELIDKATGNTLDQKRMTVAHVPYMTERGTFINNGLEYVVKNQMRLRPGVFARVKENGEIESHANIMPGKGFGHRYYLDPEKETFYMKVHQAKIPLMPLMRALGATDKQLIEAWGPRLFAANQQTDGVGSLNKMYDKVMGDRGKDTDPVARRLAIAEAFNKMEVDPDVMQRTLGKPHKTLGLDSVLDITKKLLGISRGEQDVDDRDHMAYQTIHGVEDLMSERIKRDFGNLRRNLLYKSSFKGNLNPVQPGALSRQLNAVLLSSGLGQPLEELNPSEILDKLTAITRLGVGGIGDTDAIPRESRSVQPSHYGFLDLVRTPESLRAGVDIYLGAAVRKGKDGQIYAPFKDARTGETVYKSPHELSDLTVAFPGELSRRTKRIGAMRSGKMDFFPRNEVDLIQDNFENSFSPLAQLVLGKSAMKAQRMSMGSRMSTQAVSLSSPESPLVQVGTLDKDKDESFEERYSPFMGAVKAKQPGRVVKVEKDRIDVRYADGTKETVPLYNNFIFNRKSYIHNTPMVRPGDAFQAGSLLAKSNYTDDKGVTALGLNARTGYMPYKGYNFEDAIVISRSMADRMKSEHAYQHSYERDDAVKHKKTDFLSLFPGKFDRKIMDRMDDDGIIKEGQTVNYGEPLILAARQRDDAQNKLHKKKQSSYSDATELWTHHSPGVVTDVMKTEKGVLVAVKSASTMQVGDKMSGRFGDKGVIAAIVDDDKNAQGRRRQPAGGADQRPRYHLPGPIRSRSTKHCSARSPARAASPSSCRTSPTSPT